MRLAIPPIREPVDELTHGLQREHDGQKKPRRQMLSLLASGQARNRQEVAALLGVHRHTIGRWLALYAAGGGQAGLATDVPVGKPVSLAPEVLASLEEVLGRPEGFASYEALRQWVRRRHGVEVNYKTLDTIVRTRFRTTRKVPRPSHTKNPRAMPECQATCRDHLRHVMPADHPRPVRVLSQDERRVGGLTVRRRRMTACGIQPVGSVPHVCEWCYVDGAVAPITGERFFLEWPSLHADLCQLFLEAFAQAFPDRLNIRLLDTSGAHTARRLRWPEHVCGVWWPPSSPELNPIERVWRDRKETMAWEPYVDLTAQREAVGHGLQAYDAPTLQSLTG